MAEQVVLPNTDTTKTTSTEHEEEEEETIDDWQLDMNFHVFSKHTLQSISSERTCMELECVESLTPVDMMNLVLGEHDATGHCVWMGAYLLLDALGVLLQEDWFRDKKVLELGCGTGIAGIGLLCVKQKELRPKYVLLTDADPDALQVCQRNCQHNQLSDDTYGIQSLMWGQPLSESVASAFDTALATDVLYDIASLQPLLDTAYLALKPNHGLFILSHVPRACYSSEHPPVENLDQFIVERAQQSGWVLQTQILPNQLPKEYRAEGSLNETISLQHMHEMGASLFVFRKSPCGIRINNET